MVVGKRTGVKGSYVEQGVERPTDIWGGGEGSGKEFR
jgi:hypothetical protein